MSNDVDSPRLLIDDTEVNLDNVWIHAQDDPYPGGHRYSLWLPLPLGREWMKKLALDLSQPHDGMEYLSRDGLDWLASELSVWRMEQEPTSVVPLLFVINTISQIMPIEHGVEVCGICSPFVRGQQSK